MEFKEYVAPLKIITIKHTKVKVIVNKIHQIISKEL